jgi:hypothetical protein
VSVTLSRQTGGQATARGGPVDVGARRVSKRHLAHDPGVVHQDIEAVEVPGGLGDPVDHLGLVRKVGDDSVVGRAVESHAVEPYHGGADRRKRLGRRAAYPAGRAGEEGPPALEQPHHGISPRSMPSD